MGQRNTLTVILTNDSMFYYVTMNHLRDNNLCNDGACTVHVRYKVWASKVAYSSIVMSKTGFRIVINYTYLTYSKSCSQL